MITFLKDGNNSKGQGYLMIFYHSRDGDLPRDGDCPMDGDHHSYDDHPRDVGHHWDHLEDFDHLGRVAFLREFYHRKGWLLNFGSIES